MRLMSPDSNNHYKFTGRLMFERGLIGLALITLVGIGVLCLDRYPGSDLTLAAFLLATGLAFSLCWGLRPTYFSRIAASFLFLGFPLKFAAVTAFGVSLIEPVGAFDFSPSSWDEALHVCTAGFIGVSIGHALTALLPVFVPRLTEPKPAFAKYAMWLLAVSAALGIAVFVINYRWAIHRIGVVPLTVLPSPLGAIISFASSWGIAIWFGAVAFWLVEAKRISRVNAVYIVLFVGLAASISIGGRAQFLLYAIGALLFLQTSTGLASQRVGFRHWGMLGVTVVVMLGVSLAAVSVQRALTFSMPAIEVQAPPTIETEPEAVELNEPATSDAVVEPNGPAIRDAVAEPSAPTTHDAVVDPNAAATYDAAVLRYLYAAPREVASLFVMRWIGLDGVMAVQAYPHKHPDLLVQALAERDQGVESLYQKIAKTQYVQSEIFNFQTLAGPFAVSYYAGSLAFVVLAMVLVVAVLGSIEKLIGMVTHSSLPVAIASSGLAYYFMQTTFPRYSAIYAAEVMVLLMAIVLFERLVVRGGANNHIKAGK